MLTSVVCCTNDWGSFLPLYMKRNGCTYWWLLYILIHNHPKDWLKTNLVTAKNCTKPVCRGQVQFLAFSGIGRTSYSYSLSPWGQKTGPDQTFKHYFILWFWMLLLWVVWGMCLEMRVVKRLWSFVVVLSCVKATPTSLHLCSMLGRGIAGS